jgi:hypothetical protein
MCTVTYFKRKNGLVLTSSRDEKAERALATTVSTEQWGGFDLIYPIDPKGLGTWLCYRSDQKALVLLNGGYEKHFPIPPYRMSRGLIVLELIKTIDFIEAWRVIDLNNIEPFTIIAVWNEQLIKVLWDGQTKHLQNLSSDKPHIWSSVTLYDAETRMLREKWYTDFLSELEMTPSSSDLLTFHRTAGKGDLHNGLRISREDLMLTKNITQIEMTNAHTTMHHSDLMIEKTSIVSIQHE